MDDLDAQFFDSKGAPEAEEATTPAAAFAAASKVTAEIFHGDDAMLHCFKQRVGNHIILD
jgi:hypothetical protein